MRHQGHSSEPSHTIFLLVVVFLAFSEPLTNTHCTPFPGDISKSMRTCLSLYTDTTQTFYKVGTSSGLKKKLIYITRLPLGIEPETWETGMLTTWLKVVTASLMISVASGSGDYTAHHYPITLTAYAATWAKALL